MNGIHPQLPSACLPDNTNLPIVCLNDPFFQLSFFSAIYESNISHNGHFVGWGMGINKVSKEKI